MTREQELCEQRRFDIAKHGYLLAGSQNGIRPFLTWWTVEARQGTRVYRSRARRLLTALDYLWAQLPEFGKNL